MWVNTSVCVMTFILCFQIRYDGMGTELADINGTLQMAMTHQTFYWFVDTHMNSATRRSKFIRTEVGDLKIIIISNFALFPSNLFMYLLFIQIYLEVSWYSGYISVLWITWFAVESCRVWLCRFNGYFVTLHNICIFIELMHTVYMYTFPPFYLILLKVRVFYFLVLPFHAPLLHLSVNVLLFMLLMCSSSTDGKLYFISSVNVPFAGQKNEKVNFQRHLKDITNLELP